jgi:hypothetical protein
VEAAGAAEAGPGAVRKRAVCSQRYQPHRQPAKDKMATLKIYDDAIDQTRSFRESQGTAPSEIGGRGCIYCLIEPDELRGLLSRLAGTELVSSLIQELLPGSLSAREAELPPALL